MGAAVQESGIPREDLFITTKLPLVPYLYSPCEDAVQSTSFRWHHAGRVQQFFDDSLNRLGVDYVDLVCVVSSRFASALVNLVQSISCIGHTQFPIMVHRF